ncbi:MULTISPECIES: PLP-dependent aminotransferase family protein [Nocardiaceae]|uniref:DNA-binding transcriptional MocR family regulator n=1 Tax=Rhodococcoides corynebacterioides TaxID=53972 RepID=A0ABS2KQV8_9NOCA|nr:MULTISPECIES: PLP-dependent aminotransferase family protein [Rhodococcus]MBM7414338.1 DNA-binding transcriptional MocR family regulator [Rhodococcus corynebacterioides]MBP1116801.1 DNA-binding transcriptional MocR family regulator [Rhodococcus sp. PvP016]
MASTPARLRDGLSARTLASAIDMTAVARDSRSLYLGLAQELHRLVEEGAVAADARLPAERVLASVLGVSRVTVASAYRELREHGIAVSVHGAGTFVVPRGDSQPWGGILRGTRPGVLEFVNAAPPASALLGPAYGAAARALSTTGLHVGYVPTGVGRLREAIARYYSARGLPTTADQILVTAGASDALHAVIDTFVEQGNRVLTEHPTYPGAIDMVRAVGGKCVPVAIDPDDPDTFVENMDRAARQHDPVLAYLMPDHSNPSGAVLPETSRRRLAATLHRHAVVTVVDEASADLRLDGDAEVEPFGAPVPDSACITVGSLSKTVWGGLRVGWVRADTVHLARVAMTYARRQLSVSMMDQYTAVELFGEYDAVVAHRADQLRAGRDTAMAAVTRSLPGWTFHRPRGGLSLWCTLPSGVRSTDLVESARGRGLLLAPGSRFGTGYAFDECQRIPFSRSPEEIEDAVAVLAELVGAGVDAGPRESVPSHAVPEAMV